METLKELARVLELKRWLAFVLTGIIFLLTIFVLLSLLTACGRVNPNMNTNGPTDIPCPKEVGQGLCTSTRGHFDVSEDCEYQTDTPNPILIKYSTIHEGVSLLGQLTPNEEHTMIYEGGSTDHFTCLLDFSSTHEHKTVNFEIIKQK